jgi:hypothetical protein
VTVRELIAQLTPLDPTLDVYVHDDCPVMDAYLRVYGPTGEPCAQVGVDCYCGYVT